MVLVVTVPDTLAAAAAVVVAVGAIGRLFGGTVDWSAGWPFGRLVGRPVSGR